MKKIYIIFFSYEFIFLNNNVIAEEKENFLKVGLLAPFSGEYRELGNSLLLSTQLALNEIGDKNIIIVPRDSGSNNSLLLNRSIGEMIEQNIKVVIGPISKEDFKEVSKYKDMVFISPSNINSEVKGNIISIGITLESQLTALAKFIKKQNRKKTLILYPKNEYEELIDKKINNLKLNNSKIFKYSSDPKILTGEIQKITNYSQRKINLEARKKMLEGKDDAKSIYELKKLEERYTLGKVNFDSIIVIDFGNSLKSVLTSLVFSDVDDSDIIFTTVNQWFDKSIFYENSLKTLYYPSVNYENYSRYKKEYSKLFNSSPAEITIITYDALGLIYYIWKKNKKINSIKDFLITDKISGKVGNFRFENNRINQELHIYKAENNKFTKF